MTTSDRDKVLVVVPCLNEAENLPKLLAALLGGKKVWRVVIADGGSTDGSKEIVTRLSARHPNLFLLANPKRLQSAGVNLAVQRYGEGAKWFVRIDAHCGYPSGYIEGLVATAEQTGATSVVVPMVTRGRGCFQRACAVAQNSALGTGGSAHRQVGESKFVDHGHHALFDLQRFSDVGGYDENFSHNEDAELDLRLLSAGAKIWLESTLSVIYYPRSTPMALFRQYKKYGEGRAKTIQRHRSKMKVRQMAPLAVAPAVALFLISPWFWPLAAPGTVWALVCLLLGAYLGTKSKSACAWLSGVAAMIMHLSWSLGFWTQMLLGTRPGAEPEPLEAG